MKRNRIVGNCLFVLMIPFFYGCAIHTDMHMRAYPLQGPYYHGTYDYRPRHLTPRYTTTYRYTERRTIREPKKRSYESRRYGDRKTYRYVVPPRRERHYRREAPIKPREPGVYYRERREIYRPYLHDHKPYVYEKKRNHPYRYHYHHPKNIPPHPRR
jgi:hypothetical protein